MAAKKLLSQQEIDTLFSGMATARVAAGPSVELFDFSRLDRIPKSQLRIVHQLHESFIRNVSTSLGGYLRTYLNPNLVSLEQISYGEFVDGLETPTCIAYVTLRPFDGTMLIEIGRPLLFACVGLLLGGDAEEPVSPGRALTEIEKNLAQNLLRILLADLRDAWRSVADIRFEVSSLADEPHGLRVLTPAEAVVAVAIEMKVGTTTGMVNMAIPAIFIKQLRDRFERLQNVGSIDAHREDHVRMAEILKRAGVDVTIQLDGGRISTEDLAALTVGDVLMFEHAVDQPVEARINDHATYLGAVATSGDRLAFSVQADLDTL